MGNQATRTASSHRKQVIHSWTVIYNHNPSLLNDAIRLIFIQLLRLFNSSAIVLTVTTWYAWFSSFDCQMASPFHFDLLMSFIYLSTAWLRAAELTPTWVWALVDLPETMHATYRNNEKFMNMISRVNFSI